MVANSSRLNQWVSTFMVGTKIMATPMPTRVRAAMAGPMEPARPSQMEPMPARMKNRVMVLRGPQESDKSPAGICMRA